MSHLLFFPSVLFILLLANNDVISWKNIATWWAAAAFTRVVGPNNFRFPAKENKQQNLSISVGYYIRGLF